MGGNRRRMSLAAMLAGSLPLVVASMLYGASAVADPFAALSVTRHSISRGSMAPL